ncbi:MAG: hypothetical protein OEZ02_00610 [Anaerolineae bacterium]|nr:hypothetical protein [Anaerolineae bacterium]
MLLISLMLFFLFISSDFSNAPQYGLFFWGGLLFVLGLLLLRKTQPPPLPSQRFRTLRKISKLGKQEKQE